MSFKLPVVPYLKEGLKSAFTPKALDLHINRHHDAYVNNLNNLVNTKFPQFKTSKLEAVISEAAKLGDKPLFNNAAQIWNHSFFWRCMTPTPAPMSSALNALLSSHFGSADAFKETFINSAVGNFGSGWTWLVQDTNSKKLEICNTSNAGNPWATEPNKIPLLTVDVWEHSYYPDHENLRAAYLKKYYEVIDWKFVESQLNQSKVIAL